MPGPADGPAPLRIGEVAARTELSLRSLRHWEDVGLLRPSGRTDGGFRLYSEDDVERILVIRRMKPLGFPLERMSAAMRDLEVLRDDAGAADDRAAARERLSVLLDEAAERRQELQRRLEMAEEFMEQLAQELR